MRYMFKILTLGSSNLSLQMIKNGKLEHQFQDHEISRWNKELNVGTDKAVIELDVVLSSTIDFDTIIPTSDGILYFLDPNDVQQFELFEIIIDIIQKLGRTVPLVVVFYTRKGLIGIPSNFLLEFIWENYLIEAFVFDFYSKNTFYEVLECLSEAMITGHIPINVETAWMRIPYFMQKINRLLENEKYKEAGNLTEILKNMKKKFEKQDYYINAEQAAWLYYKAGEYLPASTVLQGISDYADKFIRIYVENMIHQGTRLYNMKRFHSAAEKFEKAYVYASIEINDAELADKALKLAITTWIKSTEFQNAYQLLEKLDFEEQKVLMGELTPSIAKAVDWLIDGKKYDIVKAQLYLTIDRLQRMGLFDEIKILGEKLVTVLKILINQAIEENDPHSANLHMDELFNIWETFHIEREDMDETIRAIAILFLDKNQFSIVDKLINYVQSYPIQRELTELRQTAEEEFRKKRKDKVFTEFTNAIAVLQQYVELEIGEFSKTNATFYKHIEQLKKDEKLLEATSEIKNRANWFKAIGHSDFFSELLIHLLELYLDSNMFLPFLQELINLRSEEREDYLKRSIGKIQNKIEILTESEESLDKTNQIIDNFARIYRNHLLYDETKDLEHLHVKFLTLRGQKILDTSTGLEEAPFVLELLKQADMVYQRLSEKEPLKYDNILEEITLRHIRIMEGKLKEKQLIKDQGTEHKQQEILQKEILSEINETNRINEKIKDSRTRTKLHKRITDIEGEISKDRESEKIENEKIHMMVERLSRLKQMANEELLRQQDTLTRRQGVKRVHYQSLLGHLQDKEYSKALQGYENQVKSLFSQRKIDLAEIDLAVITTLAFITKDKKILKPIRKKFSKGRGFVSEVIDFIITLIDYPDQSIHLQAIKLFENLAFFQEERALLYRLVKPTSEVPAGAQTGVPTELTDERRLNEVVIKKAIEKLKMKEKNLPRRKMMERKYWRDAQNNIKSQNYSDASREYFEKINQLVKNNHEEFFPVSLVLGIVCLVKVGKAPEAKRRLEKLTLEVNLPQDIIQNLPEYKLLDFYLAARQKQDQNKTDIILESFIDNLPLLPSESGLILDQISPSKRTEIKKDKFKDFQIVSESTVLQNQQLANLERRAPEEKERLEESFNTRNARKRMVYQKILDQLSAHSFEQASELYFKVAITQTTRRDYDTASVLVLLGGLCLLKSTAQVTAISSYLNNFLERIGFSQKVVSETFVVKLLQLLIDARAIEHETMFDRSWKLLQTVRVFDEEKVLFEK